MKKIFKTGLTLLMGLPMIAGTAFIATACDSSVTYENVTSAMSTIVTKLEESNDFSKDFDVSVYQGKNNETYIKKATLKATIPQYDKVNARASVSSKIAEKANAGELNNEYVKIRMLYDATWSYCYNLFMRDYNLLKDKKIDKLSASQQKAANKLNSEATSFYKKISKQEASIQDLRTTLYDLGSAKWDSALANNVLYNYEKDYKDFVRSGLNLAIASTNFVEQIFVEDAYAEVKSNEISNVEEGQGEEETQNTFEVTKRLSDRYSLEVLDVYFTLLVDEVGVVGYDETTTVGAKCYEIYQEYLDFIASLFKGIDGESRYVERVTLEEVDVLENEQVVISEQIKDTKLAMNKINIQDMNTNRDGDYNKLNETEAIEFEYINTFYREILKNWWHDYMPKLFKTGVIS